MAHYFLANINVSGIHQFEQIHNMTHEQKIAREPPIPRFDSGGRFGGGPVNFSVKSRAELKFHHVT